MKRIFIAVKTPLEQETKKSIHEIRTALKNEKIKWVNPDQMHLTLKFLGDTHEDQIAPIEKMLLEACESVHPFRFELNSLGVFKNIKHPRVLWIGMKNKEQLTALNQNIENSLEKIGIERSDKAFSPHLTLGRVKFIQNLKNLHKLIDEYESHAFQEIQVKEIVLFESLLTPEGPVYKVIKTVEPV